MEGTVSQMRGVTLSMKEKFIRFICILLFAYAAFPLFAASSSKTMYVSLDPASLKESASSFSRDVATIDYAAKVRVLEEKKNWVRIELVNNTSVTGWIPSSALSSKKIKAKGSGTTADADEIALAGKGFTSSIEAVYADEYAIDYEPVNFVEAQAVTNESILAFIREGGLAGGNE